MSSDEQKKPAREEGMSERILGTCSRDLAGPHKRTPGCFDWIPLPAQPSVAAGSARDALVLSRRQFEKWFETTRSVPGTNRGVHETWAWLGWQGAALSTAAPAAPAGMRGETASVKELRDWWTDATNDVIRHAYVDGKNPDEVRWVSAIMGGLLRAYNRGVDSRTVTQAVGSEGRTELQVADVARIIVEHTDGVLWKQPENDGHISRFTTALNLTLAAATQSASAEPGVAETLGHEATIYFHESPMQGDNEGVIFCKPSPFAVCTLCGRMTCPGCKSREG